MNSELLLAQQEIINNLLRIPLEGRELKIIFDDVLAQVVKTPWMELSPQGGVFLADNDKKELKLLSTLNFSLPLLSLCSTIKYDHCLCGKAALSGEIIFKDCVDEDHEIGFADMKPHGHYSVPIKDSFGTLQGVLVLYVPHGHVHRDYEVYYLQEVAFVLANIIARKKQEIENLEIREREALHAMVTTYNHEINNPLTIAIGSLNKLKDHPNQEAVEKLTHSLKRIQDVMIQIRNLPLSKTNKDSYANLSEIFVLSRDTHFPIHILNSLDKMAIISATDLDGNITYFNDLFVRISGYNHDELIGKNHRMLKSERHPSAFYQGMWSTIKAGKIWHGEVCNKKKNGEEYWVDSRIIPYHDGYISIRFDTTHLKQNVF